MIHRAVTLRVLFLLGEVSLICSQLHVRLLQQGIKTNQTTAGWYPGVHVLTAAFVLSALRHTERAWQLLAGTQSWPEGLWQGRSRRRLRQLSNYTQPTPGWICCLHYYFVVLCAWWTFTIAQAVILQELKPSETYDLSVPCASFALVHTADRFVNRVAGPVSVEANHTLCAALV